MLKLSICGETKVEKDKELILHLDNIGDEIRLVAVDRNGCELPCGILLSVTLNGDVELYGGVNEDIGLNITKAGYVRVTRE